VPKSRTIVKGWFHLFLSVYLLMFGVETPLFTFMVSFIFHLYRFKSEVGEKWWRFFDYIGNFVYIDYFVNHQRLFWFMFILQMVTFYICYNNVNRHCILQRVYCGMYMISGTLMSNEYKIMPFLIASLMLFRKKMVWKKYELLDNHDVFQIMSGSYFLLNIKK